jgi:hypothetical protein
MHKSSRISHWRACRSSGSGADQVRAADQPQDREGARHNCSGHIARHRRRGYRVSVCFRYLRACMPTEGAKESPGPMPFPQGPGLLRSVHRPTLSPSDPRRTFTLCLDRCCVAVPTWVDHRNLVAVTFLQRGSTSGSATKPASIPLGDMQALPPSRAEASVRCWTRSRLREPAVTWLAQRGLQILAFTAISAPCASARSLAQAICGCVRPPKPQSAPAIIFSGPTRRAKRRMR